jgi:hypothetical protein
MPNYAAADDVFATLTPPPLSNCRYFRHFADARSFVAMMPSAIFCFLLLSAYMAERFRRHAADTVITLRRHAVMLAAMPLPLPAPDARTTRDAYAPRAEQSSAAYTTTRAAARVAAIHFSVDFHSYDDAAITLMSRHFTPAVMPTPSARVPALILRCR